MVLFGTPMMVLTIVMTRRLWVQAVLEDTPDEKERTTTAPRAVTHGGACANR